MLLNILLSVLESVGPEIGDCEDGASVAPDICKLGLVPLECELNATFATSTSNQSLSFENHLSTHFQQKEVF